MPIGAIIERRVFRGRNLRSPPTAISDSMPAGSARSGLLIDRWRFSQRIAYPAMEIVDLVLLRDQYAPLVSDRADAPLIQFANARVLFEHQCARPPPCTAPSLGAGRCCERRGAAPLDRGSRRCSGRPPRRPCTGVAPRFPRFARRTASCGTRFFPVRARSAPDRSSCGSEARAPDS